MMHASDIDAPVIKDCVQIPSHLHKRDARVLAVTCLLSDRLACERWPTVFKLHITYSPKT